MFIGHFAPAFVAAALTPEKPRLGLMFIAAQLVDWAFFAFVQLGIEHMRLSPGITAMNPMDLYHMPYTHSLLGSAAFAAGFALLVWLATRDRLAAALSGAVVLSHWFLDLLVHAPDLTIAGDPPKLGLGLWRYPAIEMPLELGLTFGALAFFLARTCGPGLPALTLAAVLLVLQGINWFGAQPEEVTPELAFMAAIGFALPTIAAWWLGRTRVGKSPAGLA
ncbi:hypothetical protein [Alteriqipengyuania sp.]|uniref:hypothetical protein n=1 Tax=Alteriqipengyuania sp. TaxID=2800692 RepID=UPI00351930BC